MKVLYCFLGVLFIFAANNANAVYYDNNYGYTYPTNNNYKTNRTYTLNKQNTDIKQVDYSQDTHYKTRNIRPYVGVEAIYMKRNYTDKDSYFKNDEGTYFRNNSFGGAAVIGVKAFKYFGIEGFYQRSFKEKKDNMIHVSVPVDKDGFEVPVDDYGYVIRDYEPGEKKERPDHYSHGKYYDDRTFLSSSYGIDLLAYLPLNRQLELLASVGVGQYEFETKAKQKQVYDSGEENWYNVVSGKTFHKDFDSTGIRVGVGLQYTLDDMIAFRGMIRYVKLSKDEYIKDLIETSLGVYYLF